MALLEYINTVQDVKLVKKELLPELADELRKKIIETTAKNGGHHQVWEL